MDNMKERNVIFVTVLGLLTLGIYPLIWLYLTRKEINDELPAQEIPSFGLLLIAPLAFIALAVALGIITSIGPIHGGNTVDLVISFGLLSIGLLVLLTGFGILLWWHYRYCMALEHLDDSIDGRFMYAAILYSRHHSMRNRGG